MNYAKLKIVCKKVWLSLQKGTEKKTWIMWTEIEKFETSIKALHSFKSLVKRAQKARGAALKLSIKDEGNVKALSC